MANSTLIFPPSFRVLDTDGNPVSGAKIRFFEAGTSTPKVVYSDANLSSSLGSTVYTRSDGYPVVSSGSSTVILVYTGTDSYKMDILRSDDTTLYAAQDNIIGAPNITAPEAASIFVPVTTTGSPVTLAADDKGKLFNAQSNTITFPAASILGDGWFVFIRNGGGSGTVTLSAASGIAFMGQSLTSITLQLGEGLAITCDGTAYRSYADVGPIIDMLAALTSPATADELAIYDASATRVLKITLSDVLKVINSLTEDTSPDGANDFLVTYDASASGVKKVKHQSFAAAQSDMEAATAITLFSSPGRQHFHPGHPKAGGNFDGSGTPAFRSGDYGMGAITDNGTGDHTLALDTAFNDTNYWMNAWCRSDSTTAAIAGVLTAASNGTKTASAIRVTSVHLDGSTRNVADLTEVGVSFWGDYA